MPSSTTRGVGIALVGDRPLHDRFDDCGAGRWHDAQDQADRAGRRAARPARSRRSPPSSLPSSAPGVARMPAAHRRAPRGRPAAPRRSSGHYEALPLERTDELSHRAAQRQRRRRCTRDLSAIAAANTGSALAYGADEWTSRLRDKVREVFEHPDAEVFPVISGTAANSLALAALCPPWGAVLCHETAHILRSECGATSMFGGGATMRGLAGQLPRHARRVRGRRSTRRVGRPTPLATVGAVADHAQPITARSTRPSRSPNWWRCPGAGLRVISTAHASPTLSPHSGAAPPISPGEPASTRSRSARPRTAC